MTNSIFAGIFDTATTNVIPLGDFISCIIFALISGLLLAFSHSFKTKYTKSFLLTLALLPMSICVVIMMVNGNIGAGVAVAGAFSLIRFRSNPGTAKEIGSIFSAMAVGLICGMGYLSYSLLFTIIICLLMIVYECFDFGIMKRQNRYKNLVILIPESLNYSDIFDDTFAKYLSKWELVSVKTTNLGSLYKLSYEIVETDSSKEKELIDELRCKNGNLEISISRQSTGSCEL